MFCAVLRISGRNSGCLCIMLDKYHLHWSVIKPWCIGIMVDGRMDEEHCSSLFCQRIDKNTKFSIDARHINHWLFSSVFIIRIYIASLSRHAIEIISALLVLCVRNPPVTDGLPSQRASWMLMYIFKLSWTTSSTGTKPLSESMLTCRQRCSVVFTWRIQGFPINFLHNMRPEITTTTTEGQPVKYLSLHMMVLHTWVVWDSQIHTSVLVKQFDKYPDHIWAIPRVTICKALQCPNIPAHCSRPCDKYIR